MAKFMPGTSGAASSEVELSISCRNLLDCDVFSKSDPMCVISLKSLETNSWKEIFRTETIYNNLNPSFSRKPVITYQFEVQQQLKFDVYDVDKETSDLSQHDYLGNCSATLGQIVSAGKLTLRLTGGRPDNRGELMIHVEELSQSQDEVTLQFQARGLVRRDWLGWLCSFFGNVSPFLEISKVREDGEYAVVHRTEHIRWSNTSKWRPFTLPVRALCGDDMERDIRIRCYDYSYNGNHELIAEWHANLKQTSEVVNGPVVLESRNIGENKRRSHRTAASLEVVKYEYRKVYSFLDYIMGGLQVNCTFAIDFTSSNGDPASTDSLHYISPYHPNQYEQALRAVGEIVQDYDSDKLFPVLGFGARLPPDGRVSHEFFVNLHPDNPYCEGISGVLSSYKTCIQNIQLYGPTNFSSVINHVANFARMYVNTHDQYFILLIITDGIITDMDLTKKAIVNASALPMSIIIVGVGGADFSAMNELDADTVPLSFAGKMAVRDIVQFVPFREFQNIKNPILAQAHLAKEVLAEIPFQIVDYMKRNNVKPRNKQYDAGDM